MRRARGETRFPLTLDLLHKVRVTVDIIDTNGGFAIEKNLAGRDLNDKVMIRSPLNYSIVGGKS